MIFGDANNRIATVGCPAGARTCVDQCIPNSETVCTDPIGPLDQCSSNGYVTIPPREIVPANDPRAPLIKMAIMLFYPEIVWNHTLDELFDIQGSVLVSQSANSVICGDGTFPGCSWQDPLHDYFRSYRHQFAFPLAEKCVTPEMIQKADDFLTNGFNILQYQAPAQFGTQQAIKWGGIGAGIASVIAAHSLVSGAALAAFATTAGIPLGTTTATGIVGAGTSAAAGAAAVPWAAPVGAAIGLLVGGILSMMGHQVYDWPDQLDGYISGMHNLRVSQGIRYGLARDTESSNDADPRLLTGCDLLYFVPNSYQVINGGPPPGLPQYDILEAVYQLFTKRLCKAPGSALSSMKALCGAASSVGQSGLQQMRLVNANVAPNALQTNPVSIAVGGPWYTNWKYWLGAAVAVSAAGIYIGKNRKKVSP